MAGKFRIEETTHVLGITDGYRVYDADTGEYRGRVGGRNLEEAREEIAKGRVYAAPEPPRAMWDVPPTPPPRARREPRRVSTDASSRTGASAPVSPKAGSASTDSSLFPYSSAGASLSSRVQTAVGAFLPLIVVLGVIGLGLVGAVRLWNYLSSLRGVGGGTSGLDAAVPSQRQVGYVLGSPSNIAGATWRWRQIAALPGADELRVICASEDSCQLWAPDGADAPALAARLGVDVSRGPASGGAELTPSLRIVGPFPLNLRDVPSLDRGLLRTMPRGTVFVALEGNLDGESRVGLQSWIRAMPASGSLGWANCGRYRLLFGEARPGAIPSPASILSAKVPAARVGAVGRDTLLARVEAGETRYWVALGRDLDRARSYVVVRTARGSREIDDREVDGIVENVVLARAERRSAQILVFLGFRESGAVSSDYTTWRAYLAPRDGQVWESPGIGITLAVEVGGGPRGVRGYWPLRVDVEHGRSQYLKWDGSSLVFDPITGPAVQGINAVRPPTPTFVPENPF